MIEMATQEPTAGICRQDSYENEQIGQITSNPLMGVKKSERLNKPINLAPNKILNIDNNETVFEKPLSIISKDDFSCLTMKTKNAYIPPITKNKRKSDCLIENNIDEKKIHNTRRNIRVVINENNFDKITINAQREESERLARVQGLKKLVKQKNLHSACGSISEGEHEVQDGDFLHSYETMKRQKPQIKTNKLDLKGKHFSLEDSKSEKKLWSQLFPVKTENVSSEKKDIVFTIDSSSDDDCIILSDSDDCLDDGNEDNISSGIHVKDALNIPNENGKVMVNIGHVESEPDIFLAPQIAEIIKPHQIGGVRFLFDNIVESTKRFNISTGFGCILAHSMGLGKTLQIVSFSDIFLRHTDAKTILCVMPINTIQNWVKEYNMWLPEVSPNHTQVRPRNFKVFALNDQHKTMTSRAKVLVQWHAEGGVLLIGYELFRVLGLKIKRKGGKPHESFDYKRLLDNMHSALVRPGPDLVICDEGHRIKNAHAGISVALKQIKSRRRVVLTGYPLQNNLLEYWCMVDFVRPNYLGSKTEFCNMFERPIQNGQCIDSTPEDIKLMKYRAHVLHSLLVGFVQRRSHSVLQNSLPQKLEYVILVKMTNFQRKLYGAFMNEVVRKNKVPNPLKAFAVCCKIWNHPDVLYNFLKKTESSDLDLDIYEHETAVKGTSVENSEVIPKIEREFERSDIFENEAFLLSSSSQNIRQDNGFSPIDQSFSFDNLKCPSKSVGLDINKVQRIKHDKQGKTDSKLANDGISYDWAISLIKDYEPGILSSSPKMQILLYILDESIKLGDRVLVFSQSLLTLNCFEVYLQSLKIPETGQNWKKNVSYFRLDGSTGALERERLVNEFNINTDVKLFLISTRAGSLGINLTGANRVVVFDASWNPCHDTQAVHRVYRYGQGKTCYIYRIVMDNCLEKNIYDRQVKKQGMSDRVVDECNPDAHLSIRELTNLCYDKEQDESTEFKEPLQDYSDDVLRSMLNKFKAILSKEPFYHESLLIDRKEKKLSKTEKKLAKRSYEIEKKASIKPHQFIQNVYNVRCTVQNRDSTINKINPQAIKDTINQPHNNSSIKFTRWIPAEVWQRQGMCSQEMKLPIDVAIPSNINESSSIIVKAGEKVMILNSPKGVYMQLESGKIIAIKTTAEAARDKLQKRKSVNSRTSEEMSLPRNYLHFKEDACRKADQPCNYSKNNDCILINDSINDISQSSLDISCTKKKQLPKNAISQISLKTCTVNENHKEKISAPTKYVSIQKYESDATTQMHSFQDKTTETKYHHHRQESLNPIKSNLQFFQNKPDKSTKIQKFWQDKSEPLVQDHVMQADIPVHQRIQKIHDFGTKLELSPPTGYVNKQLNHPYQKSSLCNLNYDMIVPHMENKQITPMSAPQWRESKSPETYKHIFKISNIPAPYPSTAVCGLSRYEESDKPRKIINANVNVERYDQPPYKTCIGAESSAVQQNVNSNFNYQLNTASNLETGLLHTSYYFNNKKENIYCENLYENSDTPCLNYNKQLTNFNQDLHFQNYARNHYSDKVFEHNVSPSVASENYVYKPATFSTSLTNENDVGFNYAESQRWIIKQIPE